MKSRFFLMMVGFLLVLSSYSFAQVPQLINYQGKLTDSLGKPVNDTLPMTFSIYADPGGLNFLWTETQGAVIIDKGIFNVILGSVNPIPYSVFDGPIRYLGIKIGLDPEITPRRSIVGMPYAYKSFEADTADYARGFSGSVENTDKVDGFHASSTPTPGYLYPLDGSAKIPNDRLYTGSGNGLDADLLDGQHASDFLSTANDYGRSGVASDLYEGVTRLTDKYVDEGQAGSVNTGMIQDLTIQRLDVVPNFKAPYSDTADYARAGKDWSFRITETADTTLITGGAWGIARYANILLGSADSTHVNLGVACTTGESGFNWKYCTVGGGYFNAATGLSATVGGGAYNIAHGENATVGGGYSNRANGYRAAILGGLNNTASGFYSTVGAGSDNTANADWATVGGGYNNTASDFSATVGGGYQNTANSDQATVGGGRDNLASAYYATVGGGRSNIASNQYATVAGGYADTASGWYANVGGGNSNSASNEEATVSGGYSNKASGSRSTIAGGYSNAASGSYATVGGGGSNSSSGPYATIGGGRYNRIDAYYSTIPGGYADTVAGDYSFATGNQVRLTSTADLTFAFGYNFTTSTDSAVIFYISGNEVKVGIQTTNPSNILTLKYESDTDPVADDWTTYPTPPQYSKDVRELTSDDHQEALKKIISVQLSKYRPKAESASGGKEKIGLLAEGLPEELQAEGDNNAISIMKYITLLHAALKAQQEELEILKDEMRRMKSGGQ